MDVYKESSQARLMLRWMACEPAAELVSWLTAFDAEVRVRSARRLPHAERHTKLHIDVSTTLVHIIVHSIVNTKRVWQITRAAALTRRGVDRWSSSRSWSSGGTTSCCRRRGSWQGC